MTDITLPDNKIALRLTCDKEAFEALNRIAKNQLEIEKLLKENSALMTKLPQRTLELVK